MVFSVAVIVLASLEDLASPEVSASPNLLVAASALSATPAVNSARRSIISTVSLMWAPDLLQPLIAAAVPTIEFIFRRILLVEILMIFLGRVERSGLDDLCIDRLLELDFDLLLGGFRQLPLFIVVEEDRGSVLRAVIAELLVLHGRIDRVPVIGQQLLIGHDLGVIDPVSYTHLRAHETDSYLVCRLLL